MHSILFGGHQRPLQPDAQRQGLECGRDSAEERRAGIAGERCGPSEDNRGVPGGECAGREFSLVSLPLIQLSPFSWARCIPSSRFTTCTTSVASTSTKRFVPSFRTCDSCVQVINSLAEKLTEKVRELGKRPDGQKKLEALLNSAFRLHEIPQIRPIVSASNKSCISFPFRCSKLSASFRK